MADWFKARRLDRVVAAVKSSPLLKLFLGGGPAFEELSPAVSRRLYKLFRPEIEKLEEMLHRDLSAWKSPSSRLEESLSLGAAAAAQIGRRA
jgi:hypothetical protein